MINNFPNWLKFSSPVKKEVANFPAILKELEDTSDEETTS